MVSGSTTVARGLGTASSNAAPSARTRPSAQPASQRGVRRMSTATEQRSGTTEYPCPPLMPVTVTFGPMGKSSSAAAGISTSASIRTRVAAFTTALSTAAARLPLWAPRPNTETVARQNPRAPTTISSGPG